MDGGTRNAKPRAARRRSAESSGTPRRESENPRPVARLVYVDDRIVAVDKPPGLSLATPRTDPKAAVRRLVASIPAELGAGEALDPESLWLAHRLDVGTSGLVLLARDAETHREIVRLLGERRIEKTYLALVWGHPRPKDGFYDSPVGPDTRDRRRMRVDPEGRPALSRYRTIGEAPHVSLLELKPETGRTHQLRVHLAHAGHWIVGDDLYGGPRHRGLRDRGLRTALNPPHLLLHAWRLAIPETESMRALRLEAPLPPAFADALLALGSGEGPRISASRISVMGISGGLNK